MRLLLQINNFTYKNENKIEFKKNLDNISLDCINNLKP